jgi:phosphoribosyl-ATP pyrophosphohydrolase
MASADPQVQLGRVLDELESTILSRRRANPSESYVAGLLGGDEDQLLKKIAEEAGEVMLAAKSGQKACIAAESADLLFHMMVMLARYDLGLKDVILVLQTRQGRSGIAEKALRSQDDSS